MARPLALVATVAALVLAACGDDEAMTPATPAANSSADADAAAEREPGGGGGRALSGTAGPKPGKGNEAPAGTEVKVAESQFGPILFDAHDQAIYVFAKETSAQPECYGDCAAAWPPVLTEGDPVAGSGADARLLGTTKRDDGSRQVTYGGQPLYYYAHEGPGEVLCHGVDEYGGLWLVVDDAANALPA